LKPQTGINPAPFTGNDAVQYARITKGVIEFLKKNQNYEPAIDDEFIDQYARAIIESRKADSFLCQNTTTEYTYTTIADGKTKLSKIMNDNINQLGISRRNRLHNEPQTDIMAKIKEEIEEGKKWYPTN